MGSEFATISAGIALVMMLGALALGAYDVALILFLVSYLYHKFGA